MKGTVRCPYCVTGVEFHPMVAHVDDRHICNKCGHTTRPSDGEYECHCPNCSKLVSPGWRFSSKQRPVVRT
jgi:ribosomal protein S27AE